MLTLAYGDVARREKAWAKNCWLISRMMVNFRGHKHISIVVGKKEIRTGYGQLLERHN